MPVDTPPGSAAVLPRAELPAALAAMGGLTPPTAAVLTASRLCMLA